MSAWIESVAQAASRARPGCPREELQRAETEAGYEMPEELRAVYARFDGGDLPGDVHLFCLHARGGEGGVVEKSRMLRVGLPAAGLWRFGRKGEHLNLFAARKSALLAQSEDTHVPAWARPLPTDTWLYGTWAEDRNEGRLYPSLEALMRGVMRGARGVARAEPAAMEGPLKTVVRRVTEGIHALQRRGEVGAVRRRTTREPQPLATVKHPDRRLPTAEDLGLTPGEPPTPMPVNPPPIGLEGITSHEALRSARARVRAAAPRRKATRVQRGKAPVRKAAARRAAGAVAVKRAPVRKAAAPKLAKARGPKVTKRPTAGRATVTRRAAAGRTAVTKRGAVGTRKRTLTARRAGAAGATARARKTPSRRR
ncbi:MAG: SMI1/KNR4 family protein [Myxococcaceae bacterium]|nr:SMI1/KNR4 family protein [Myxococcaceae bacterium]